MIQTRKLGRALLGVILIIIFLALIGMMYAAVQQGEDDIRDRGDAISTRVHSE